MFFHLNKFSVWHAGGPLSMLNRIAFLQFTQALSYLHWPEIMKNFSLRRMDYIAWTFFTTRHASQPPLNILLPLGGPCWNWIQQADIHHISTRTALHFAQAYTLDLRGRLSHFPQPSGFPIHASLVPTCASWWQRKDNYMTDTRVGPLKYISAFPPITIFSRVSK